MALGEDAVEVLEIYGHDLEAGPPRAEVIEAAAKGREVLAGPAGALGKEDERVPIGERLDHAIDRLPAELARWRAGSRGPVDEDGVEDLRGEVSANGTALPVVAGR